MSPEKFVKNVEWFLHHTQGFEMRSGLAALIEQYYAESELVSLPLATDKLATYDWKEYTVYDTMSMQTHTTPPTWQKYYNFTTSPDKAKMLAKLMGFFPKEEHA